MSQIHWIVCERTSRWASALRLALSADGTSHSLRETRHFAELHAVLAEQPASLVAIEVDRANFATALGQFWTIRRRFIQARCVALFDRSLAPSQAAVADAVVEAGVVAWASSPRRLESIRAVGRRHAAANLAPAEPTAWLAQLWATLPWQAD